jgi:hypothetical protein
MAQEEGDLDLVVDDLRGSLAIHLVCSTTLVTSKESVLPLYCRYTTCFSPMWSFGVSASRRVAGAAPFRVPSGLRFSKFGCFTPTPGRFVYRIMLRGVTATVQEPLKRLGSMSEHTGTQRSDTRYGSHRSRGVNGSCVRKSSTGSSFSRLNLPSHCCVGSLALTGWATPPALGCVAG